MRRAASRRANDPIETPSRVTVPASALAMPATSRSRVDLPAPFGPSSPVTLPVGSDAETSRTIMVPSMANDKPSRSTPTGATSFS